MKTNRVFKKQTNTYSSQAPHAPQNAKSSVQETLQSMKVEHVNNKDNNAHVSQKHPQNAKSSVQETLQNMTVERVNN